MIVVLLPTIPERIESCGHVLRQLAQQTVKPDVVYLIHDLGMGPHTRLRDRVGAGLSELLVEAPSALNVIRVLADSELAQCTRWKLVDSLVGSVVFTLDDDLLFEPDYIAESLTDLSDTEACFERRVVLSHGGVDMTYRWRHYYEDHPAGELILPQAGTMAFRASTLRGLFNTTLGRRALRRGGSEEIPVAVKTWIDDDEPMIYRPAGCRLRPSKAAFKGEYTRTNAFLRELLVWCQENTEWPHAGQILKLYDGKRNLVPAPDDT